MPVKKSSSPHAGAGAEALDAAREARTNAKPESARKARPRTRPAQQSMDAGARPGNLDEAARAAERAIRQSQELIAEVHETVQHALEQARGAQRHGQTAEVFAQTLHEVLGDRSLDDDSARRAALSAAASVVWPDAVGPLLTSAQAREVMRVSRQRLDQLAKAGRLIALTDRSDRHVYPAWQFTDAGRPIPALADAHRQLVEGGAMSEWSAASWCVHEHPELHDRSPRDWMLTGGDGAMLSIVAGRDAARSAQ